MSADRFSGSDVSDAMRALWARQARDDEWRRQQDEAREVDWREQKARARAEQVRAYGAGQARRRRR